MGCRRALIFGITGQDGAYLARSLLDAAYDVYGASRCVATANLANLRAVAVADRGDLRSVALTDAAEVQEVIATVQPDEIYNLAGQSSVGRSFEAPAETLDGIISSTINILEAIRREKSDARFYNAGSSEIFGNTKDRADESAPLQPRSPYGTAKAAAFWIVKNYRDAYDLFACSGILFNHESPLRPAHFVTQKVVRAAAAIAEGCADVLELGELSTVRDWGWAPDYVEAMRLMLAHPEAEDFVIASGVPASLQNFVAIVFARHGLDWRQHVQVNPAYKRPLDVVHSVGDASKAQRLLGWRSEVAYPEVADRLVAAERERRAAPMAVSFV